MGRPRITEVEVRRHAIERWRQRMRDQRGRAEIAQTIRDEVAAALAVGGLLDHKPPRYRLFGQGGALTASADRFLLGASGEVGWVVRRELDGRRLVVITTLTPTVP